MRTQNMEYTQDIMNGEEFENIVPILMDSTNIQRNKEIVLNNKLSEIGSKASNIVSELDISGIISNISSEREIEKQKKVVAFDMDLIKNDNNKIVNVSKAQKTEILLEDKVKGLKYVATKDKNLLEQYYKMRNDIFHADRGWTNKEWFESDFDRKGQIILAVDKKNNVVGGARLMTSTKGELLSGELEGTEFVYSRLFENMGVDKNSAYGEIDGLIVEKGNRDRTVTERILKSCIQKSLDEGCKYLVGIAHPAYCRIYRAAYKATGYSNVKILKDFIWFKAEEYNYSKDCPIVNIIS